MNGDEQIQSVTNGVDCVNQNNAVGRLESRILNGESSSSSNGGPNAGSSNPQKRRAPAARSQFFNNDSSYGDSVSMTSKTSRSSRFVRRFSARKSKAGAWLVSKLHKHQRGNDISASFNLLDQENKGALVNINTASEEELMTVRGITRVIAQNIVEYRAAIGRFRRLQDLALVSGIGANKFPLFCKDLTIGDTDPEQSSDEDLLTRSSSPPSIASAPSPQPWPSYSSTPCHSSSPRPSLQSYNSPLQCVNINTATIFELMTVPGINQEMAANILHYREKKGLFRSVDELSKVRGMRLKITRQLRPHLTTDSSAKPQTPSVSPVKMNTLNGKGHRRTLSAPQQGEANGIFESALSANFIEEEANDVTARNGKKGDSSLHAPIQNTSHRLSMDFSSDVYDLLSLRSERPEIIHNFENKLNGRKAIRIASWNLSKLTSDKISNPGVLEVICRTILERNFTILAVQDILGADLLKHICNELNNGTLRRVKEWPGSRGLWEYVQSSEPVSQYTHCRMMWKANEYGGFLYNRNYVDLLETNVINLDSLLHHVSKPFVAQFQSNETKFVIGSFHLKASNYTYLNNLSSCKSLQNEDPFLSALDINLPVTESLDNIKKNKNLQNGLIKESQVRDELPINGLKGVRRVLSSTSESIGMVDELKNVMEVFREYVTEEDKNVVVCGDFANIFKDECYAVALSDYKPLLDAELASDVTSNFCVSASMLGLCAEQCYAVREGLSHLAIPCGWGWGGSVSTQCPLYLDTCVEPLE